MTRVTRVAAVMAGGSVALGLAVLAPAERPVTGPGAGFPVAGGELPDRLAAASRCGTRPALGGLP